MLKLRKVATAIGIAVAVVIASGILYVWLVLPTCTILPSREVRSPDDRFTAVIESRKCRKPQDDWAMVLLRSRDRAEQPIVFRLLEANGPIYVRWADWSRLEVQFLSGAKTWQSTQPQGGPSVRFRAVEGLK